MGQFHINENTHELIAALIKRYAELPDWLLSDLWRTDPNTQIGLGMVTSKMRSFASSGFLLSSLILLGGCTPANPQDNVITYRFPALDLSETYSELLARARGGDPLAMGMLSMRLHESKRYDEAIAWTERAAEDHGCSSALLQLGDYYARGVGVKQNGERAFHYFLRAAQQGEWLSMREVARRYMEGLGVTQDYDKGWEWLNIALQNKNYGVHLEMAQAYLHGLGVESNPAKAFAHTRALTRLEDQKGMPQSAELQDLEAEIRKVLPIEERDAAAWQGERMYHQFMGLPKRPFVGSGCRAYPFPRPNPAKGNIPSVIEQSEGQVVIEK